MGDGANWYRINELEKLSGVSRRNVHFYLEQGLLHAPRRTGRTMAYYDDGHLAELDFIRTARAQGTPLFAIKEQLSSGAGREASKPAVRRGTRVTRIGEASKTNGGDSARGASSRRGRPPGRGEMRKRILDVGCRLFLSKGFRATAVSDITAELNVGKGSFYFHFSDKDELFLECAPRLFQGLFAPSWDKIRSAQDPVRRLQARAEAVMPVLDDFCAILAMSREALQSPQAKIRKMGRQVIDSICTPLADDLRTGMAQGKIRSLDPAATSAMLIGVMESFQYLRGTGAELSPEQARDAITSLILFGLGAEPVRRDSDMR